MNESAPRARRLAAVALATLTLTRVAAAGDDDEEGIEVIVRAPSTGAFVSRTSTDTTPREPIDAASLIDGLPSVHVRRLGADGSFGTLSIRGSASTQVAVLLAGIPLTSGADPSVDAGSLPLWPGATIRAYRGFAPARLGATGYLGGVLTIDPKTALIGSETEVWAATGSFGSLKLRAGDARREGPLTLSTALSASRGDGDFTYELFDPAARKIVETQRENAAHVAVSGLERASYATSWGTLGATLFAEARRRGLSGTTFHPTLEARLETTRLVAGVDALVRSGKSAAWHAALFGRRETSTVFDPLGELGFAADIEGARDTIETLGTSIGWRGRPVDALTIDLFTDGRAERFAPEKSRLALSSVRATRLAAGLGSDAELRASDALRLSLSGRIDARRDDADGAFGPTGKPLGVATDLAPSGHAGASLRLRDEATLSLHAGALERPPSFVELYGDRGALLGDPSLRPERALSIDAGIQGDFASKQARFGYEVVGFASAATDLIVFEELGEGTLKARNVDSATIAGAEITLDLAARQLTTRVSYTLLFTENTSDAPLVRGRPLPGRPVHDLSYDAAYALGPLRFRYGLDAIAGTTNDAAGRIALPARVLHGVGATFDVPHASGLRIGVQVDNLLDLRTLHIPSQLQSVPVAVPVSDLLDYPLPGRTLWITARFAHHDGD